MTAAPPPLLDEQSEVSPGVAPPSAPPWWRRWRGRLTLGVVVAVVLGVAVLLTVSATTTNVSAYDPDNPEHNGAQALARVLAERGVHVDVARGEEELRRADPGLDTTIVVTNTSQLRPSTSRTLRTVGQSAARLVLVRPSMAVVREVTPTVAVQDGFRLEDDLVAECDIPDVREGERLGRAQTGYRSPTAEETCFAEDGYAVYLAVPLTTASTAVLIGSTDVVTNDRVDEADNAAIALRTMGHTDRVIWYVPDLRDVAPTAQEQGTRFFPAWFGPALLLGLLALLAVMGWRGRRLGRLVTEPIPVVVRAIETTESRGRMYRKARDAPRAAAVLRDATRRRLAASLGLPGGTAPQLAAAVAAATSRPYDEIRWLLEGPPPTTDADLLTLATQLSALEKEVRRP